MNKSAGSPARPQIDVQHLRVFESTYRLASQTRAAQALGLTQSALSKSLRVLRAHFADPLFVRTAHGMAPTPRAQALIDPVRTALRVFDDELRANVEFDARSSDRCFAFFCSDMGAVHFLPRLLAHAAGHAPRVNFQVVSPVHAAMPAALASGEADLAIGPFPELGAGLVQQVLYRDHYVCLVAEEHPRVRDSLTLEDYRRERHVLVSAHGTAHAHRETERLIVAACDVGRVGARVSGFMAAPFMVRGTDYLVTLPALGAQRFVELGGLRIVPCPLPLPPIEVRQYWHERYHNDPGNRWLRNLVFALFAAGAAGEEPAAARAGPSAARRKKKTGDR